VPVIKHPRKGKPSTRFLVLRDGIIGLVEKVDDVKSLVKKGYPLSNMKSVEIGQTTSVFSRTTSITPVDPSLCLSVVMDARSLDIQCLDPKERGRLHHGLIHLLSTNYKLQEHPQSDPNHKRVSSISL
jgi:hypothetical protein